MVLYRSPIFSLVSLFLEPSPFVQIASSSDLLYTQHYYLLHYVWIDAGGTIDRRYLHSIDIQAFIEILK